MQPENAVGHPPGASPGLQRTQAQPAREEQEVDFADEFDDALVADLADQEMQGAGTSPTNARSTSPVTNSWAAATAAAAAAAERASPDASGGQTAGGGSTQPTEAATDNDKWERAKRMKEAALERLAQVCRQIGHGRSTPLMGGTGAGVCTMHVRCVATIPPYQHCASAQVAG